MKGKATALVIETLPPLVRERAKRLSPDAQEKLAQEYQRKRKSAKRGYLWWLLGMHHFYFGKRELFMLFWLLAAPVAVWALWDLFRIPAWVRDHNASLAVGLLQRLEEET